MNMIRTDVEIDVGTVPVKRKVRRLSGRAKARGREQRADLALEDVLRQRLNDGSILIDVEIDRL